MRELFLSGLQKALAHYEASSDSANAIHAAQRWATAEPLCEEAHRALIRLYASLGRNTEALAQYQLLEQTLQQELGTAPQLETQAFVHSLRPTGLAHRPLVGRTKELRALANQLSALKSGKGGVVVLEGEPGLGKTRLLEEVARLARWHRLDVLRVLRGGASEQLETPYAPLDSAMQSAGELLAVASPLMRETLRPLLEPTSEVALNSSSNAVSAALERWFLKLGEPLVILLDDLHWAGDLFWALVPVLSKMAQQQVLLVLSHRSHEVQSEPFALEALNNLRREGAVLHLELGGLSLEECGVLAKALGNTLEATKLNRLYRLSSGNPLVFGEFLQGNNSAEHLEGLHKARFEHLDERSRQALQAASVLGNVLDPAIWAAMLDFVPRIRRLIEARFIHQQDHKLFFQHDLIRSLIYQGQSQAVRQAWHARVFRVLRGSSEPAATLALHAREGGLRAEAAWMYLEAASEALAFEALSQMREYLHQAMALLDQQDPNHPHRLRLRLLQLNLCYKEDPSSVPLDEVDHLEHSAHKGREYGLVIDLLNLRLLVLSAKGDLPAYRAVAEQLRGQIDNLEDVGKAAGTMAQVAHTLAGEFRDTGAALLWAERAYTQSLQPGIPLRHRIKALRALMRCHLRLGNIKAAEAYIREAEALFASHPELAGFEPEMYAQRVYLGISQNRIEEAIEHSKGYLEACRITGNTENKTRALYNLILALKIIGQWGEALVWAEEMAEHAQGNVEPNKAVKYLSTLAEVLVYLGRIDQADAVLRPMIPWLEAGSAGDGALRARCVLALLRGEQGRYLEGYRQMQPNLELLAGNPKQQATSQLVAAEMAWHAGLQQEARNLLAEAAPHQQTFIGFVGAWWWLVFHKVKGCPTDLEEARLVALAYAATLNNPVWCIARALSRVTIPKPYTSFGNSKTLRQSV